MQFNNLSVVEFNNIIKNIFDSEEMLFNCAVIGEIASFKISGNVAYFVIKDDFACLNCVWFSPTQNFKIGEKVKVVGSPNFYVRGGKLSFNAVLITSFGDGDIYKRFCILKEKLSREGYFLNKKELPKVINNIGVVTSSKGAVVKDIISVAKRRNPNVNIYIFPSKVQGEGADKEICKGINFFAKSNFVDVIIVARGGGSSEDLNAFNSELVAKACFMCETPIISAVGHETDYTLIDLVADIRASTPSVAAEIAVNESKNYKQLIDKSFDKINSALKQKKLNLIEKIKNKAILKVCFDAKKQTILNKINFFGKSFKSNLAQKTSEKNNILHDFKHKIELKNPNLYKTLGLAIIQKNGEKINDVQALNMGETVEIFLNGGKVFAKIEKIEIETENKSLIFDEKV